jgi:serine/threonine protein kinase
VAASGVADPAARDRTRAGAAALPGMSRPRDVMITVGSVVAGYRIERVLGAGGMGTVYLAQNPDLPGRDALKVLSAELSRNEGFRARFVREADVAAGLSHPNIVSVYTRGQTDDGQLWIAMQFVDGTDADAALRAGTMTAVARPAAQRRADRRHPGR